MEKQTNKQIHFHSGWTVKRGGPIYFQGGSAVTISSTWHTQFAMCSWNAVSRLPGRVLPRSSALRRRPLVSALRHTVGEMAAWFRPGSWGETGIVFWSREDKARAHTTPLIADLPRSAGSNKALVHNAVLTLARTHKRGDDRSETSYS